MRPLAQHHIFGLGLGHHLAAAGPVVVWVVVLAFVFVECAFLIGLFLPGDSLLFTAGVVLAGHEHVTNALALAGAAVVVAAAGNMVGYWIGRRAGTSMIGRPGARVLTAQRLAHAHAFLDRHGSWSIVLARWIPWIRTLAPLVAGAARMDPRRFAVSTTIGALAWVPALVLGGYYGAGLMRDLPWLKVTVTVLGILFFVVGTGVGIWRYRKEITRSSAQAPVEDKVSVDS
jgi:membrane-associated protein